MTATGLLDADVDALDAISGPEDLRALDADGLEQLALAIRAVLVSSVARNGGHLGSNLGVVELTLALHRVFDSPDDVILWDTGHQAYAHKLVTGRRRGFDVLRKAGGLAGYPCRAESQHDWIENSHASTATSYAHGMALARRLKGERGRVVAVVGDGALTGGLAYEGLNNIGASGVPAVIVVNDNGRSYAPTVSPLFADESSDAVGTLGPFAEALGFDYLGPIDGHDVPALEAALHDAGGRGRPVLVHARTVKGKGYPHSEHEPSRRMHDAAPFDPATGPRPGWTDPVGCGAAFADAVEQLAARDPRIVAITAAMGGPVGLDRFAARFPDRLVDVGIAEQHALAAAAGLAMQGLRPVVALYSTFLNRAFDQLYLDIGLHGLPVVIVLDRSGITGPDGPSHHGILDLAHAAKVPGLTIFTPSSAAEVGIMLRDAVELPGPSVLRYGKGAARWSGDAGSGMAGSRLAVGADVCIVAVGAMVADAVAAAELLCAESIAATVWDVRVAKPLDATMVADAARHPLVVTLEDGVCAGGIGASVAAAVAEAAGRGAPPVRCLGVPDRYLAHGDAGAIRSALGLDGAGVAATIRDLVGDAAPGR